MRTTNVPAKNQDTHSGKSNQQLVEPHTIKRSSIRARLPNDSSSPLSTLLSPPSSLLLPPSSFLLPPSCSLHSPLLLANLVRLPSVRQSHHRVCTIWSPGTTAVPTGASTAPPATRGLRPVGPNNNSSNKPKRNYAHTHTHRTQTTHKKTRGPKR